MLARCVATLKPPPELTLSQWADRYRMLSAESSAEPGRWHTDKAPYQREIMDAMGWPCLTALPPPTLKLPCATSVSF